MGRWFAEDGGGPESERCHTPMSDGVRWSRTRLGLESWFCLLEGLMAPQGLIEFLKRLLRARECPVHAFDSMVADGVSSCLSAQDGLPLSHLGMRRLSVPGVHHIQARSRAPLHGAQMSRLERSIFQIL